MKILTRSGSETLHYAATELLKYVRQITRCALSPDLEFVEQLPNPLPDDALVLGLLDELCLDTSDLSDPFMEDILDISVQNARGYLAGSNERSVLMAVYKYCVSAGCRFVRPGEGGEYVPYCDLSAHSFTYRKKADYPFRGECCEGAISYEHMRDTVYWMPKVGMNMYMIEGIVPYTYMHRWYGHEGNRILREPKQVTSEAMLEELIAKLERDIVKTGVQFHAVGHGWMFEKMGVGHGTYEQQLAQFEALPQAQKDLTALVNGKRGLFGKDTFYTHFCYSNPAARRMLVDFCVEYIRKKPYIDYLHVWLADNVNNQCECENCVKMQPSDWYVVLLNEIDEALEQLHAKTRLVFIAYNDTVRPPEKMKLKHPERFVLLAAIGQHYETGYKNTPYTGEIPPYVRNRQVTPSNALRLQWHREWKEICGGIPSIIFEYRFYTDQYCDPGYMRVARETYRDMRALESVGFQGCMNDQTHRMYLPTSLPLLLMGETLFDKDLDLEAYTNDYFAAAFGEDGALCRTYLETLSTLFCPANLRGTARNVVEDTGINSTENKEPFIGNAAVGEQVAKIPAVLDAFLPVIRRNMALDDPCRRLSWVYLRAHSVICRALAEIVYLATQNDMDGARAKLDDLEITLSGMEEEIHNAFDLFLFIRAVRGMLKVKPTKYFQ